MIEIGPDTEKSPGDLRRLAGTQTSLKDHKLTLMLKTQGVDNKGAYKKNKKLQIPGFIKSGYNQLNTNEGKIRTE